MYTGHPKNPYYIKAASTSIDLADYSGHPAGKHDPTMMQQDAAHCGHSILMPVRTP